MDKFDNQIKQASTPEQLHPDFVNRVMTEIKPPVIQRSWKPSSWLVGLASATIVLTLAFVGLQGFQSVKTPTGSQPSGQDSGSVADNPSPTPTTNTDDASLASDISSIQQSQNQGDQDLRSAESSVNDMQPTIDEN